MWSVSVLQVCKRDRGGKCLHYCCFFLNLVKVFMRAFNDVLLYILHLKYICHSRYWLLIKELFFTKLGVFTSLFFFDPGKRVHVGF